MKIIIKTLSALFLLISNSFSEDVSSKISANINDFISNLVPGEGITETSIDLRNNNSPDFSILATRELEKTLPNKQ